MLRTEHELTHYVFINSPLLVLEQDGGNPVLEGVYALPAVFGVVPQVALNVGRNT